MCDGVEVIELAREVQGSEEGGEATGVCLERSSLPDKAQHVEGAGGVGIVAQSVTSWKRVIVDYGVESEGRNS